MKVAFSTTDGTHINEHFGRAERFVVYDFSREGYRRLDDKMIAPGGSFEETKGTGPLHEKVVNARVEFLSDCKIIYVTMIGAPSAARLVQRGIMPVKVKEGEVIEDTARHLMDTIQKSPPPWMRKLIQAKTE